MKKIIESGYIYTYKYYIETFLTGLFSQDMLTSKILFSNYLHGKMNKTYQLIKNQFDKSHFKNMFINLFLERKGQHK